MPKYAKDFVSARLCHVTQDTVTSISGASFFCVLDGSMTITMNPDNQTFRLNKEEDALLFDSLILVVSPINSSSLFIHQDVHAGPTVR